MGNFHVRFLYEEKVLLKYNVMDGMCDLSRCGDAYCEQLYMIIPVTRMYLQLCM